jgi:hypothetical protein
LERNKDLVEKFLAIAEAKVSIIDEYGDENWDALPGELKVCLKKIANREQLISGNCLTRKLLARFDRPLTLMIITKN